MTYKELATEIQKLTEEQQNCDVTIQNGDGEFYWASLQIIKNDDRLDENHPIIQSFLIK